MNSTKRFPSFFVSEELYARIKAAAEDREMTVVGWTRQAMLAYLRTAEANGKKYQPKTPVRLYWPSGYPKETECLVCGKCHDSDPWVLHEVREQLQPDDVNFALEHPCK